MKLPQFRNLTKEQQDSIEAEKNFAVYGGAGTGKTVVAIWRHIRNWNNGKKSYLITFTHTLTYFLEFLVFQENRDATKYLNNINAFMNDFENLPEIEELIIDEAQDVSLAIHEQIFLKFPNISYGADDKQHLYQNATTQTILENIYKPNETKELSLNFRNSYHILELTKALFPDYGITQKMIDYSKEHYPHGKKPELVIYHNQNLDNIFLKIIKMISNKKNIAILVPTIKLMNKYKAILNSAKIEYSSYNYKDLGNIRSLGIKRIHLTTFHSSKGLEFDNVILPEFQLFGKNAKYYVGFTRAKTGLYLLSNGDNPISEIDKTLYSLSE
jgi:superfamily I DNA/RNA helicase